jgi:hypothetical protein
VDVGEVEVAASVAVGEAFVVEAEEVEHAGVEVVDVDFVFDSLVAIVVGGAVAVAGFDSAAGRPEGEAFVIAAVAALGVWGAAELAGADGMGYTSEGP